MASIGLCSDITDAVDFHKPRNLLMKPIARLNVSVQLPQLKGNGSKNISNWELMEKIKKMVKPEQFLTLKVAKSTLEFVRFEGEIENKSKVKNLVARLDSKTIKLGGFPDALKVRAAEAKIAFPQRHDWDSYFRDAKNMNEMKPGERPDTVHFRDLPCRWFSNSKGEVDKPCEMVLRKVFETFGEIRCVDIPTLDPYRKEMTMSAPSFNSVNSFSTFSQDLVFEAFVQYKEYVGFCKAMTSLKGMKLVFKETPERVFAASVKVDFDKLKHLSDKNIKKRRMEREQLMELEKIKEERVRKEREEFERRQEEERRKKFEEDTEKERRREEKVRIQEERRKEREERRLKRRMEKKKKEEHKQMQLRIQREERRILIAQRKLETIRLLSELFNRIKVIKQEEEVKLREQELEDEKIRQIERGKRKALEMEKKKIENEKKKAQRLVRQEQELREKILRNMRAVEEKKGEKMREDLRQKISGKTKLKSAVIMAKFVKVAAEEDMETD